MKVAVLIPCYNEEVTIGKVIDDFKRELPSADIYVYDNNSKDRTSEIALEHGAIVKKEFKQGKGNVVRSMFQEIDADCYVMVDGDDTYPAEFVHQLIEPIRNREANMVIGDRLSNGTYLEENKRAFHNFGNNLVRSLINGLYKSNIKDIMTGYRAYDKLFVKSIPVMSPGFEIETEMSLHALDKRFRLKEIAIDYRDRPEGSESKLNTFSDGFKVLRMIFTLFKEYKPLQFFSIWTVLFIVAGLAVGAPVLYEFFDTGFITKVPSSILATGLMVLGVLSFVCGLILDTIASLNRKQYELELNKKIEQIEQVGE
ncbi:MULTISPECIES: glycosyltransferase family 2 protein [Priestia]|jgi:glycosyltransferase involved in cell wall biosynthesis|uniref:Glycosyl transferase, family 2 n=3 Tax=Priestia TaxID=2800373 RepID=D5DWN3_PRIM1|nr:MULTISPECIES: glycosyltransferase family 2 protein [Priestia]AVX11056.1 glycosyl transferase [Bacillus sp. Y-01]KQU18082.1 glycosyl transferase [Bacillus sp. Leaf75]KRD83028.1 glycosyl transferase [Bacillus sp. Root147]KRD95125.1 glycosyl transferase [Bacillus sp. Root239]KRF47411.1 glycosyl transferase [Bacillus sp. Soil531]MBK0009296.1 glycosyltransferase [Bacillus sp. S35]MBK0294917.1 glycosyltransferase [Bacillus sp. S34]MBU8854572.1 glycosyltransferase family 2 protein [Bacillus sp.